MTDRKDVNDPSQTSSAYDCMAPKWDMIETLLAGTGAMRAAGGHYLPRHEQETATNYSERLERATLLNMTELTLNSLVGKPFSEPVTLGDDVPEALKAILPDIDLQGNDISVFARSWFREAMAKSFAHVLIDMPALADAERAGRTREDDLKENRRPFWSLVRPENVIFATAEVVNGQERLTHVRIRECVTERVGFAETFREQIRVLEPGSWSLYEKRKVKGKKEAWVQVDKGVTTLDFIPLVTFYANRTSLMEGKPPLEDLAYMNVRHWQSTADQINVVTVARFPILAVAGASDSSGEAMAIGPRQLLGTKDASGRFYYVEHTGRAIAAGRQELLDLEDQMANYGTTFLKKRPSVETATGRIKDSAESTSPLQDAALRFSDALMIALNVTAQWMGLGEDAGGTATVNTEFEDDGLDDITLRTLNEARRNRDISRKAYLNELKRRGLLDENFDPENDIGELMTEEEIVSPFSSGFNKAMDNATGDRNLNDGGNSGNAPA